MYTYIYIYKYIVSGCIPDNFFLIPGSTRSKVNRKHKVAQFNTVRAYRKPL